MSPGNICHRGTDYLTEKYVGPMFSLGIVAGEGIPVEHSPVNIPQRQVTGEFPQRQVVGKAPKCLVKFTSYNQYFKNRTKTEIFLEQLTPADLHRLEVPSKAGEVGVLRDHSSTLEREKNEINVKVIDLSALVKVREREVADLDALVTVVKLQNDNLVDQGPRLAKPLRRVCIKGHLLGLPVRIRIFSRQLNSGDQSFLRGIDCENSYFQHPNVVFRCIVILWGCYITHGVEGRKLANVALYNPSAKADYVSALQRLQNVSFFLIAKLKSNKDASVDTIINLLRLDDALTERLGLTESQPYANQLMVPIHHYPDQRVIGASALSFSLDVFHSRVRKIRENIAIHVSALRGVFVPLFAAALEGTEGTFGYAHDTTTTLSVTFVSAGTILPISTDDYEVAHADGQEGASVDGETAAVENINFFSNFSNAELNILE
nr:RING/U-box superfamily protein [Tanacetum cinerariifolium]